MQTRGGTRAEGVDGSAGESHEGQSTTEAEVAHAGPDDGDGLALAEPSAADQHNVVLDRESAAPRNFAQVDRPSAPTFASCTARASNRRFKEKEEDMLKEPGNLSDFGPEAQEEWHVSVVDLVERYLAESGSKHFRLLAEDGWPEGVSVVDWDGFPRILQNCLGDEKSMQFCDWKLPTGDWGRVLGQDEYCEWRTVRNPDGKLVRVEVTTELAEYWKILAAFQPMKTLRVLGRFAGEQIARWEEVYGPNNPFGATATPESRAADFDRMMVWREKNAPVKSPYNNGQKAIAFLSKPISSLNAAVALFITAAIPYGKQVDGNDVALDGPEAIASTKQAAIDCRNSDPNMVGRMNEIVWDGRAVAFDDPVGVYIRSFAHTDLLDPDGNPIPQEWVDFQRGSRPHHGVGQERSQRLVIEVPPSAGFVLEDLVNADTNENIRFGYQIAELTKLSCYFRTSGAGAVNDSRSIVTPRPVANCSSEANCSDSTQRYEEFRQSQRPPAVVVGEVDRTANDLVV